MSEYRGITYPSFLGSDDILSIWKINFCPKEIHLFDEVESGTDHYLHCDACGLMVFILKIQEKKDEKEGRDI